MRDRCELLKGLPADTPGWRILASELRIFFFKFGQLAVELIVLAVSNGGRRFLIIATIVPGDVAAQRFDTRTRFRFGHVLIIRIRIRETMACSALVIPSREDGEGPHIRSSTGQCAFNVSD